MADPSRRPLKSRDTALAARVARWLAGTAITPNQISAASILFAALAGAAFWASAAAEGLLRALWLVIAGVGIQFRLLCNLFDGMVAIEGGKQSPTGHFWNEAPDRLADVLILVGMGLAAGNPSLGWAAAALAILTAYIRELGTSAGLPPDFAGPMAKPHRMAAATVTIPVAIAADAAGSSLEALGTGLWIIAVGTAITATRRGITQLRRLSPAPPDRSGPDS